jgi:hypothetical protein
VLAEWTLLSSEEAMLADKVRGGTDEAALHLVLRTSHSTGLGVECG